MLLKIDSHRTTSDSDLEAAARQTHVGQAHFAVGPNRCGDCQHWDGAQPAKHKKPDAGLCIKAATFLAGRKAPRSVPKLALSGKYFAQSTEAAA